MGKLETAFKTFRDDATQRKKEVRRGKADAKLFMDWLDRERRRFDTLVEGLPLKN